MTSESSDAATVSSAALAALAASFQPAKAHTRAGERSWGGSPSQMTGSMARAYSESG